MRRIDLGVFDSVDGTLDGRPGSEGWCRDDEIRDLVALVAFLAPELSRHGGGDCAADAVKQWAESNTALLVEAETVAHREQREEPAELLRRARELATA